MSCYQSTSPAQLFSQFAVLDVDQGPKRTLVMIAHTRSELPYYVERPGVEWPVAPVLRLGGGCDVDCGSGSVRSGGVDMERLDFKVAGSNPGKYFIWCHYESCVFTNLSHQPQQCSAQSAV